MFRFTTICAHCQKPYHTTVDLMGLMTVNCGLCGYSVATFSKIEGHIYILSNDSMPELLKIGYTERTVAERVAELSSHTGVALPFREEASFPVSDPAIVEHQIHSALENYRESSNREFFRISLTAALSVLSKFGLDSENSPRLAPLSNSEKQRLRATVRDRISSENSQRPVGSYFGGFGSDHQNP